jgi:hypothetical protein
MRKALFYLFISLIFLLYSLNVKSDNSIQLVQDSSTEYRIMLSDSSSPTEVFSAQELQGYIVQVSGAFMPIADTNEPLTGRLIFVGASAIARLGLKIDDENLGEDGFIIKTIDRRIIIAGKNPRGTLFGVYTFLESIGCRWFAPGISGEVLPIIRNITIPPTNRLERSAFNYRGFSCLSPDTYKNPEWIDWMAKNRLNCIMIDSEFYNEFNSALEADIKLRSLNIGVRFEIKDSIANETKKIKDFLIRYPTVNILEIYDKDNKIELLNKIADSINIPEKAIYIRFNGKNITNQINMKKYSYSFQPYMRCYRHFLGDKKCDINQKQISVLNDLLKSSHRFCLYEYYMASYEQNSLPFPILQTIFEDIKYIKELDKFDGAMSQCESGNWGTYGLNYYIFSKFSWNPNYNLGRIVDDYCDKYYGNASEPIKQYFGLLEDSMEKMEHFNYIDPPELIINLIDENTLKELNIKISGAEELANDVIVFDRIRKLKISLEYTTMLWQMLNHYIIGCQYQANIDKDRAKENLKKSLEYGENLIKFIFLDVNQGVFIITESFIFDYLEPIINDIRNRLDSL